MRTGAVSPLAVEEGVRSGHRRLGDFYEAFKHEAFKRELFLKPGLAGTDGGGVYRTHGPADEALVLGEARALP